MLLSVPMIHRYVYRLMSLWAIVMLWSGTAIAHPNLRELEMRRFDELKTGEVTAGARLLVGGVWLGDEQVDQLSGVAQFGAMAAHVDYALRSRWSLSAYGSVGRLTSRARYDGLACVAPSNDNRPCTMDMNHSAWWSSLSVGLTKSIGEDPWAITLRGHGGILLRRHTDNEIFEHGPASNSEAMHPAVNDDMAEDAWHVGPLITASAGIGYMLSQKSTLGLELETQISGIAGPAFITSAAVISFSRNLSLN